MNERKLTEQELSEICEDAFINIKEACLRLQERTKCSNEVVIGMLNNLVDFYKAQNQNFIKN
tara:strand:- start:332 stop:517 length:186 start_codon:yes stop_codon:yes gene_type:complete